jgi:hypothetical protein
MENFLTQLNLDPIVYLGVGGVLVLLGIFKIISKGISMIVWVVLLVLGVSVTSYGLQEGGIILPPEFAEKFEKIIGPGKEMTGQAMKQFCNEMLAEEVGTPTWCEEIKSKPKSDWTSNDAIQFTKVCVFTE